MALRLTDTQYKALEKKFDDVFADNKMARIFEENDEYTYESIVSEYLIEDENFPNDVQIKDVDFELQMSSAISYSEWVDQFVEEQDFDSSEEVESVLNDSEDELGLYVLDNMHKTSVVIVLKQTLDEYLNEHPTAPYLAERIEDEFDVPAITEYLEENPDDDIIEKVREQAIEEGFPEDIDIDEIKYVLSDVDFKVSPSDIADRVIGKVEGIGNTDTYMTTEYDKDLVENNFIDYKIEITSDPEDFM